MKTLEQRLSEVHEYAFRKRHAMGYEKPYAESYADGYTEGYAEAIKETVTSLKGIIDPNILAQCYKIQVEDIIRIMNHSEI